MKNKLDKNRNNININKVKNNGFNDVNGLKNTTNSISVINGINNFGMSLGMNLFKMNMKQTKE